MKIEKHAYETYVKYSAYHPEDKKIAEIAEDELNHAREDVPYLHEHPFSLDSIKEVK